MNVPVRVKMCLKIGALAFAQEILAPGFISWKI